MKRRERGNPDLVMDDICNKCSTEIINSFHRHHLCERLRWAAERETHLSREEGTGQGRARDLQPHTVRERGAWSERALQ